MKPGFTLIELLVTIAIVAILATVAIGSYRTYIRTANLTEAFNNLAGYQIKMEQYYQDTANYGANNACAVAVPTGKYFTYTCALGAGGQTYTATATGSATYGMQDYTYTIDDANNRATTAFPSATVPAACWLTKGGAC